MEKKVLARRQASAVLPDGSYLLADAKLTHLEGNARPYFSLTGEQWQTPGHYKRRTHRATGLLGMGAMGETIIEHLPEFAIIERLHLADDTGEPIHAEANGWHAYSGDWHAHDRESPYSKERDDTPRELAASILRIEPEEIPADADRESFAAFVDTLRPRWAEEARQALDFLNGRADA